MDVDAPMFEVDDVVRHVSAAATLGPGIVIDREWHSVRTVPPGGWTGWWYRVMWARHLARDMPPEQHAERVLRSESVIDLLAKVAGKTQVGEHHERESG